MENITQKLRKKKIDWKKLRKEMYEDLKKCKTEKEFYTYTYQIAEAAFRGEQINALTKLGQVLGIKIK